MSSKSVDSYRSKCNPYLITVYVLSLLVPVLVLPNLIDNAFETPKNLLLIFGVSFMCGIYCLRFLAGKPLSTSLASTPKVFIFIIFLNLFSFLYTGNYYYTIVAAVMNISCLLFFHFVSLYSDGKKGLWIIGISAFSGLLVSILTYLQFTNHFILFTWAHPGIMVMGTIGNSNYLGAYLVFPLFCTLSLIFLLKGKLRIIPLICFIFMMGAFLFTRARAGWFGFFLSFPVFIILLLKILNISVMGYVRSHLWKTVISVIVLLAVLISLWHIAPQRFHIMMGFRNVTRSDTLRLRMKKYYKASWWLFKQHPLFGTGLWSFRNLVYDAQAEINKVDENYFKDYEEPKPRRVHTDYLEILNDGGLIAAVALLLFFVMIMRHGWMVIKNEDIHHQDRIIAAAAFSALIAVMLGCVFFFPFRINSTLFMTALMMGLLEGIFLHRFQLIGKTSGWKSNSRYLLIPVVFLLFIGIIWFTGIKHFKGEIEHFKYKKALGQGQFQLAEKHILNALKYDSDNTAYNLYACQLYMNFLKDNGKARDFIEKAIIDFNGDITRWSLHFIKGLLKFQTGALFEARAAYEKALYYNPKFDMATEKLNEVNKVIKDHDRVLIKFR